MGSIIGHRIDCNGGMGSERPAAHAPGGGGDGNDRNLLLIVSFFSI